MRSGNTLATRERAMRRVVPTVSHLSYAQNLDSNERQTFRILPIANWHKNAGGTCVLSCVERESHPYMKIQFNFWLCPLENTQ